MKLYRNVAQYTAFYSSNRTCKYAVLHKLLQRYWCTNISTAENKIEYVSQIIIIKIEQFPGVFSSTGQSISNDNEKLKTFFFFIADCGLNFITIHL